MKKQIRLKRNSHTSVGGDVTKRSFLAEATFDSDLHTSKRK